ncbi:aegerolysin family protein [Kitasatospora sp. NPDC094011]|uniref:aegerolysin family protein n=1 Tax=Kitasatospora sp. NPDC094011 TaxID=3364090 RepID=UPI003804F016
MADTPVTTLGISHFRSATFNTQYSNAPARWGQIADIAADNDVVALQELRNDPYQGFGNETLMWPTTNPIPANMPLRVFRYDWNPTGARQLYVYKLITQGMNRAVALVTRKRADAIIMLPQDDPARNFRPVLGLDLKNDADERGIFFTIHTNSPGGEDAPPLVDLAAAAAGTGVRWAVLGDFNRLPASWVPGPPGSRIVANPLNTYNCRQNPVSNYDYMVTNDPDPALAADRRGECSDHFAVEFRTPPPACADFSVRANDDPCVPRIPNAARSTGVSFHNRTGCDLTLDQLSLQLPHGVWTAAPPKLIGRDQGAGWGSESSGLLSGTEGRVRYVTQNCLTGSDDNRQVQLHWDNPYAGSNSYDESGSDYSTFRIDRAGGSGNNTVVTWTVAKKPQAIVAMGDSYISGEAGRWAGNANTGNNGSAWGTDRAASSCGTDESTCQHNLQGVYKDTGYDGGSGCDRSDVSEIAGADIGGIPPGLRFNLACSGATTDNVVQSEFKGEQPQVEQLKDLARRYQIKTIVLSVGGNDLNLVGAMQQCGTNFMTNMKSCKAAGVDGIIRGNLPGVEDKVVGALNAIHTAMNSQGYNSRNYRLVAQSYPGPIADADHYRYPAETIAQRYTTGGCPFYNEDANWARKEVIPAVSDMLRSAARRGDAFFLDLQDALAGHELCHNGATQATSANSLANPLPAAQAEWVRWFPGYFGAQGNTQEAIHPNAYGQQALSNCLTQADNRISSGGREFRCAASAGSAKPTVQTVSSDPNYSIDSVNRAVGFLTATQDRFGSTVQGPAVDPGSDIGEPPLHHPPTPPVTTPAPTMKVGLPQSYTGGYFGPGGAFGATGYQSSFTYDNAVTIYALLKHGTGDDLDHAKNLGNSLLYAQDHDPVNDGRIRASYMPDPFVTTLGRDYPAGTPYIGGWSVYTGNMAWAGMAFCQLYKATGDTRYLDGALRAAKWIQTNSADTRGAGGYTGGFADTSPAEDGKGMVQRTWKATEHNIDVGAFFSMLNQLTHDQAWKDRSDNAFAFVRTMLSADGNHLWTGTGLDGVTVNQDAVPEDVQTWSYLATLDPAYARTVDWAAGRMAATDGPADPTTGQKMFNGVSFSTVDTSGVWFEGTAHLLAAYQARNAPGDSDKAAALITTLQKAQEYAPNADSAGIVAASHDGLDTGQGDRYYASRHTGATAWYVAAAKGGNPFRL